MSKVSSNQFRGEKCVFNSPPLNSSLSNRKSQGKNFFLQIEDQLVLTKDSWDCLSSAA